MLKVIGSVGVDSGQVSIIKAEDVDLWTPRDSGKILGFSFWGRDEELLSEKLKEAGINVVESRTYFVSIEEKEAFLNIYKSLEKTQDIKVVFIEIHDNPYDRLFINEGLKGEILKGSEKYFYTTFSNGDGGFAIVQTAKNSYFAHFSRNSKDIQCENPKVVDIIELHEDEETSFYFVDPCYIDEGVDYSCKVSLPKGKYEIVQILTEFNEIVAFGINEVVNN